MADAAQSTLAINYCVLRNCLKFAIIEGLAVELLCYLLGNLAPLRDQPNSNVWLPCLTTVRMAEGFSPRKLLF